MRALYGYKKILLFKYKSRKIGHKKGPTKTLHMRSQYDMNSIARSPSSEDRAMALAGVLLHRCPAPPLSFGSAHIDSLIYKKLQKGIETRKKSHTFSQKGFRPLIRAFDRL